MPYTLTKGLLWFLLALLLGVVVGWLLRSIRAKSQIRAARATRHDPVEVERLKARIANLEPTVAENDRLRSELAGAKAPKPASERASVPEPAGAPEADLTDEPVTGPEPVETSAPMAETPLEQAAPPEPVETPVAEPAETVAPEPAVEPVEASGAKPDVVVEEPPPGQGFASVTAPADLDLAAAAAVIGKKIKLDDLTAIEGVGPAIAGLLNGIGVHTWSDLAGTEVSLLKTMLSDAGSRFSVHQPDTWPTQAGLLFDGKWPEFKDLIGRLVGGKLPE